MEVGSISRYIATTIREYLQTPGRHGIHLRPQELRRASEIAPLPRIESKNRLRQQDIFASLCEAVAFAHDLGHPPFGHIGERTLNSLMSGKGGFEGNGQTLRVITFLENTTRNGLELTRRTILGTLKYPVSYKAVCSATASALGPPKCYLDTEDQTVVKWAFEELKDKDVELFVHHTAPTPHRHGESCFKSFDSSLLELADDIAYAVHDIEDGIHRKIIDKDIWLDSWAKGSLDPGWLKTHRENLKGKETLAKNLFGKEKHDRKWAVGGMVNALVLSTTLKVTDDRFSEPLLRFNVDLSEAADSFLQFLKQLAREHIHTHQLVDSRNKMGEAVIRRLFEAFKADRRWVTNELRETYKKRGESSARMVCDYIASMTDSEAIERYKHLHQ